MKKMATLLGAVALTFTLASSTVLAGVCEVHYTRTACPGKEKISYRKCDGDQSCTKYKEAASIDMCKEVAVNSCSNSRYSITKSKVIKATFEGEDLVTNAGSADFCTEYAKVDTEFNQCDS